MSKHRFFVSPEQIGEEQVVLRGEQARQICYVLRMGAGDEIVVLDNLGWEYGVRLTAVSAQQVSGDILEKRETASEPAGHITLYQSLMKRDKFEWVLQKGTEVGVSRFVPLVTQRSLVQDIDIKPSKMARWQKIITEAAEQARRGRIPELMLPMRWSEALAGLDADVALIPWEEVREPDLRQVLAGVRPSRLALFVGPEGGFAQEEVAAAVAHNVQPITLGPRILRAETAAIVTAALILYEVEEE
ncbi:MAG TPA: 16S rRNA (uracil(1498)-N(3))-methyltransferase [Anaerolineae bacterium]|nr:16S rRNA (uracil(1498)-N(3))-methyltransferase [Anaerolineae bacterium]